MRIEIHAPRSVKASESWNVRAILLNDSYEPVAVSRNAFIGPTAGAVGGPAQSQAVEATYGAADEPLTLQPFTFYGRERAVSGLQPGDITVTASYQPRDEPQIVVTEHLRVEAD
jgi:hypothetical protein